MCMPGMFGGGGSAPAAQAPSFRPPSPLEIVQDKANRSDYTVAGSKGEEAFAVARGQAVKKAAPRAITFTVGDDVGLQINRG